MNPQDLLDSTMTSAMTTIAISIGATIFLSAAILIAVRVYLGRITGADLRDAGVAAQATILKLWDTGTTVNDNPVAGMLLEVQPPNGAPYQVETKSLLPRLAVAQMQPGAVVRVKIDPNRRERVALDLFVA